MIKTLKKVFYCLQTLITVIRLTLSQLNTNFAQLDQANTPLCNSSQFLKIMQVPSGHSCLTTGISLTETFT